jgi:hypothetical protein
MPGYGFVNKLETTFGFLLSARNDLVNKAFYVLNVLDDGHGGAGTLFRVTKSGIDDLGPAGWDDARLQHAVGTYMDVNGFRVAIE